MKLPVISDRFRTAVKYGAAFALILAIGVFYKFVCRNNYDGMPDIASAAGTDTSEPDITDISETAVPEISIYICGEVNNPGVYRVPAGTILNDVAAMAGGFTVDAALDSMDLVYQFSGNTSVFIPSAETLDKADSFILRNGNVHIPSDADDGLININSASLEQLITLPGVGESLGRSIIDYRGENLFRSIEDIMNVSGIGEAKFNKIKDKSCV